MTGTDFPKFFVPEEKDTEKGWGIREAERTAKEKKKLPQMFSYTTTRRVVGLKKRRQWEG